MREKKSFGMLCFEKKGIILHITKIKCMKMLVIIDTRW